MWMIIKDDLNIILVYANKLYEILRALPPPHGSVCSFLKTGLRISELLDDKYKRLSKTILVGLQNEVEFASEREGMSKGSSWVPDVSGELVWTVRPVQKRKTCLDAHRTVKTHLPAFNDLCWD